MLLEAAPDIPVLFLDTVHHFAETYKYRDEMAAAWKMNLVNLKAAGAEAGALAGKHREVLRAPQGRAALLRARTARRLVHGAAPRTVAVAREPAGGGAVPPSKREGDPARQPLASWTARDVWAYAKAHSIPLLPLYEVGYTSIGCEPCTTPPLDPDNPRSGRWQEPEAQNAGFTFRRSGVGKAGGASG